MNKQKPMLVQDGDSQLNNQYQYNQFLPPDVYVPISTETYTTQSHASTFIPKSGDEFSSVVYTPTILTAKLRYCCCFSSYCSCVGWFCLWMILFFVVLGSAVFFLNPKIPTVTTSSPYLLRGGQSFILLKNPASVSIVTPFVLTIEFAVNVSITSLNYIDYFVKDLTFELFLTWKSTKGNLIRSDGSLNPKISGYGLISNTNFKHMDTTDIITPFNLTYMTTSPIITGVTIDPDLKELLTACAFLGGNSSSITVNYTAIVDAPLISWFIKPSYSDKAVFPCHVDSN
ncbi:hypothetical protein HK096_009597, partial [Nowakowskiella sp. JEL0078]